VYAVTIVEGELVWRQHPDPEPRPGDLLVAVRAAGVNAADLVQRKGFYPAPPGSPPDIPGLELAGEVVGLGDGTSRFALGDRVMAVTGGGGQAELALVPESTVLPVPDDMAWEQAGAFPEAFSTAHDALFTRGRLSEGETVLISGAAGGVGSAAVQLAHAAGARVVASVRSPERHAQVAELGADEVVLPDQAADHGPFDVSLELVSAQGVADVLPVLAIGARVVVIGVGAGPQLDVNLLALMQRRASIAGSMLRSRTIAEKAEVARAVENQVLPLLAVGRLTVPIAEEFPLARADAAYAHFAAGGKFGKVVLATA
jgi:putative PIG3 family NAD(P)H quinone oxidoreductase